MAIVNGDVQVWRALRNRGLIPENPTVLEIGRANWYGDVPAEDFHRDRLEYGTADGCQPTELTTWTVADWYYDFMLRDPSRRVAIDLDPNAEDAYRIDLNHPIEGWPFDTVNEAKAFDIVINSGTCEHIFDQRQVWETIHRACKVGGLMVHALPLWGWLDHGFVNYHPTFVADVAVENGYEIVSWLYGEINPPYTSWVRGPGDFQALRSRAATGVSAMMHVALKRTRPDAFKVPMQGVYSDRATRQQHTDWLTKR